MGLMLSVLVFCVGVIEVLDCWHHILHNFNPLRPLPRRAARAEVPEVNDHPPDVWRASNVDISWPKDLSPSDNLHVIRRRPHSESERSEHEREGDKNLRPHIVIHTAPGDDERHGSPPGSRESSPNHLELSVIVESDSSSELEELTQIENPAYRRKMEELCCNKSLEEGNRECQQEAEYILDGVVLEKDANFSQEKYTLYKPEQPYFKDDARPVNDATQGDTHDVQDDRPTNCLLKSQAVSQKQESGLKDFDNHLMPMPQDSFQNTDPSSFNSVLSSQPAVINNGNPKHINYQSSGEAESDKFDLDSKSKLPQFTDSILSDNVMKVTCHYPSETGNSSGNTSCYSKYGESSDTDGPHIMHTSTNLSNNGTDFQVEKVVEIKNIPDNKPSESKVEIVQDLELPENILQCPDIQLSESSPVLQRDSSDSSINTSDASWLVKSRASDRSIGHNDLSSCPENMPGLFGSATKVDFELLKNQKTDERNMLVEERNVGNSLKNNECKFVKGIAQDLSVVETDLDKVNIGNHDIDNIDNSAQSRDFSKASSSLKHSSSSSSLSGIPQLPDDSKDPTSTASLFPTDNGFRGEHHLDYSSSLEYDSLSEDPVQSFSINQTDHTSNIEQELKTPSEAVEQLSARHEGNEEMSQVNHGVVKGSTSVLLPPGSAKGVDDSSSQVKDNRTNDDRTKPSQYLTLDDDVVLESRPSPDNKPVVMCRAKESDLEDDAEKRADALIVRTSEPRETLDVRVVRDTKAAPSEPRPSTSTAPVEAVASSSTSEEKKALWLIFSGEYTKAMNKDWHSGHFCCWQCDESLTGQRYVLRDEHPYCIKCYESVFSNGCEECSKTIGIDSKDLSYKEKHWHEACFLCNKCRVSLVDKQFGSKLDKIFCGNCYDAQFASRCDGCGQIFKAGTKKMEYKTRQWHEPCFSCCVCKSAIGTKSFIPREQEIYCATCYEEKFATRCVKCNKIITSGGVTYKNEPWHRECFTCSNCSTSLAGQRFTSRDEKPYCADCFGELFAKRCTACCKPITGIGGTRFISFEDRHWHNDCFICASCKTSLVGRGFITDAEDIICPECAKQKLM